MAMSDEERTEFTDSAKLMSAEELRNMKGDDAEQDAIIDQILGTGKQVEVKDPAADDDAHPNPDNKRVEPDTKTDPDEKEEQDEEDEEDDDPPAATTDPAPDAAAQAAADAAAATAQADAQAAAPAVEIPKLDLSFLDADYKAQLAALDTDKAAKFKALMDGELSAEDYAKAESEYFARRDALRDTKAANAAWFTDVHNFRVQTLQSDGVNYFDEKMNDALDDWVKRLAVKPDMADKSETEILQLAHKKVMAEFDITPQGKAAPAAVSSAAAPAAPAAKPNKTRAPDLSNLPPTIGGLPAAATTDPRDDGEFAHLDNLTGMEYERALARLTPDQKARYEAA